MSEIRIKRVANGGPGQANTKTPRRDGGYNACGLAGMKPVSCNEVALWGAPQRVRTLIPVLCSGSCRKQSAAVMVKRNGCRITQHHRHVNVSRRLRRVAGTWPPSVAWHSAISWLKPCLWSGEDQSRRPRLKFDWRRGKAPTSHPGERPRSHQQIARGTPRVLDTGTLAFIGDAHLPRHLIAVNPSSRGLQ